MIAKKPRTYVLVTNVEVNTAFRESFREICRAESTDIANFEVIGLDELQAWVTQDHHLRAQFFPMLFGRPRFELKVNLVLGTTMVPDSPTFPTTVRKGEELVCITVANVGEVTSYVENLKFKAVIDGKVQYLLPSPLPKEQDPLANPRPGAAVAPGQSLDYRHYLKMLQNASSEASEFWLAELIVRDQIGNTYTCEIPDDVRAAIDGATDRDELG